MAKRKYGGEIRMQLYVGWLDLDNDLAFFTDKEMYEKTLALMNIKKEC